MERHQRGRVVVQKHPKHITTSSFHSITKYLKKYLKFAEGKVKSSDDNKKVTYHPRKSLPFNEESAWMKKDGQFDGTKRA